MGSKDVVERQPVRVLTELEQQGLEQLEAAVLAGQPWPFTDTDSDAVSRAILERISKAKTFEEAFAEAESLPRWGEKLLGVPVFVRDVRFNPSKLEGQTCYAVVDVEPLDGQERQTVHCGGNNVVEQLILMVRYGWQDRPVMMQSHETSTQGRKTLWLRPVPAPAG